MRGRSEESTRRTFIDLGLDEERRVGFEGLRDGSLSLDLAVVEGDEEVGDRLGHGDVVRDEENGPSSNEVTLEELVDDPLGGVNVETGDGNEIRRISSAPERS